MISRRVEDNDVENMDPTTPIVKDVREVVLLSSKANPQSNGSDYSILSKMREGIFSLCFRSNFADDRFDHSSFCCHNSWPLSNPPDVVKPYAERMDRFASTSPQAS